MYYDKYLKYRNKLREIKGGTVSSGIDYQALSDKQLQFKETLEDMRSILMTWNLSFHLHSGTALGCHRERTFIEHDKDIDLGMEMDVLDKLCKVRYEILKTPNPPKFTLIKEYPVDYNDTNKITEVCYRHVKTGVKIDIFCVEWSPKGYISYTYGGICNDRAKSRCTFIDPYHIQEMYFLGKMYNVPSIDFLVSLYGKDWRVKKTFGYYDGLTSGAYKSLQDDVN